jgi:hypothetical protein
MMTEVEELKKVESSKITTCAELNGGGYVWARFGFKTITRERDQSSKFFPRKS